VFLAEPTETPYDLRWRMFGVRVRVHPFFWVVTIFLGWDWYVNFAEGGLVLLGMWVVCVFVSVLVHELGHVLVGRLFGSSGHIVLYSMGGLAVGSNQLRQRWQRIAVLFAGPGAELLFLGVVAAVAYLVPYQVPRELRLYEAALWSMLVWINLFWGLLNLLPIFPLDGGQIAREVCQAISPRQGSTFALGLSMVLAGGLAVHLLLGKRSPIPFHLAGDSTFLILFFALLALTSFQAMQMENERQRYLEPVDDDLPWER
jgi:stage IV sporulation protein FB